MQNESCYRQIMKGSAVVLWRLRRHGSGRGQPRTAGVALGLGPLDVEGEQLHLGSVETLEVGLDGGLAHQLVDGHDAEHGGLPHAALHVIIRLEEAGHDLAHV